MRVIPAEAVARAHGAAAGNARTMLRAYHRTLETGSYGSEDIPHDLTEEDREQLEDAIVILHERYPDLEDEGPDEDALVGQVKAGTAARARTREAPARSRAPAPRKAGASRGRRRAAAGGFLAGKAFGRRRALRETGVAGVADTTTSLALRWIGLLIGLSLAYLLLTNASSASPGKSAIELFAVGLSTAARTLILPLDPLRAHPELAAGATARSRRGPATKRAAFLNPQQKRALGQMSRRSGGRIPQLQPAG